MYMFYVAVKHCITTYIMFTTFCDLFCSGVAGFEQACQPELFGFESGGRAKEIPSSVSAENTTYGIHNKVIIIWQNFLPLVNGIRNTVEPQSSMYHWLKAAG